MFFKTRNLSNIIKKEKLRGLKLETSPFSHGLRMPGELITFTARPKIKSQSQILSTAEAYFVCHIGSIFQISDVCLHWVFVVRVPNDYTYKAFLIGS